MTIRPTFHLNHLSKHWINAIIILYHAFVQLDHFLAVLFFITLSTPTAVIHFTLVQISATITDGLAVTRPEYYLLH
jgi:hypothetical protein